MQYTWDPAKNAANIHKHGISFDDAISVFDGDVLGWPDERFDYGEARWIAIGFTGGEETVVVYSEKGDERRIISARRAIRKERELYWHGRA